MVRRIVGLVTGVLMALPPPALAQAADPFQSNPGPAAAPRSVVAPRPARREAEPDAPQPPAVAPQTTAPVAPPIDAELAYWQTIQQSTRASDFDEYLRRYPQGRFAGTARGRIQALRPPAPKNGSPASTATDPMRREVSKTIVRDKEAHVASSWSWTRGAGNECVASGLPEVTIVTPPRNGAVRLAPTQQRIPECPNMIAVMGVFYRPSPGFAGSDRFTFERKGDFRTNGLNRIINVVVTVQ